MKRFIALTAALCAGVALAGTPSATGWHRDHRCGVQNEYYHDNQKRALSPHNWINWSTWASNQDFIAIREDASGNETYRQWVPGSSLHETNTPDGYDRYRLTIIQRAGYSWAEYYMEEWTHGGCG